MEKIFRKSYKNSNLKHENESRVTKDFLQLKIHPKNNIPKNDWDLQNNQIDNNYDKFGKNEVNDIEKWTDYLDHNKCILF